MHTTRTVTCHYEDATGEHPIEVTLYRGPATPSHQAVERARALQTGRRKGGPPGKHAEPRRQLCAPREAWDLWDRARKHALDESWAEWARGVLTVAAAEELGIDPQEALRETGC